MMARTIFIPVTPVDVSDDVMELQVHEGQRLLQVLDMGGRVVHMPLAQAKIGAQRGDLALGAEARTQQAAGMQALQPLGVVDVALATRNRARIPRVGNDHFDAGLSSTS